MASRSQRRHRAENQSFQSFSGPIKSWIGFVEWAGRTPQRDWFRLWAGRTQGWMDGLMRMPAPSNEREERAASDGHGYDALSE